MVFFVGAMITFCWRVFAEHRGRMVSSIRLTLIKAVFSFNANNDLFVKWMNAFIWTSLG